MALKSARIVGFCGKSNGFVDFENTVDRGSNVNFDADSRSCLSWILNEIWIIDLFLVLFGMLMSSSKLFLCSNEAHSSLSLELLCVIVIKHVAFFTMWAKLTMAFTFNSLSLDFYTSVSECDCGFGFEQKCWRIGGFGEKKARISGFANP